MIVLLYAWGPINLITAWFKTEVHGKVLLWKLSSTVSHFVNELLFTQYKLHLGEVRQFADLCRSQYTTAFLLDKMTWTEKASWPSVLTYWISSIFLKLNCNWHSFTLTLGEEGVGGRLQLIQTFSATTNNKVVVAEKVWINSHIVCAGVNHCIQSFKTGSLRIGVKVKHVVRMIKVRVSRERLNFIDSLVYGTVHINSHWCKCTRVSQKVIFHL